jgi:hypothetical protein
MHELSTRVSGSRVFGPRRAQESFGVKERDDVGMLKRSIAIAACRRDILADSKEINVDMRTK